MGYAESLIVSGLRLDTHTGTRAVALHWDPRRR